MKATYNRPSLPQNKQTIFYIYRKKAKALELYDILGQKIRYIFFFIQGVSLISRIAQCRLHLSYISLLVHHTSNYLYCLVQVSVCTLMFRVKQTCHLVPI